jgi:hypothetical protein
MRIPLPSLAIFVGSVLLLILGAVAFIKGIAGPDSGRAWQTFLVNFLFWSGVAQAGPVFAAIYWLSKARWGRPVKLLAEGVGLFLPVSFGLFLVLIFGQHSLFQWSGDLPSEKHIWLNPEFLYFRDTIGLIILYGLSLLLLYHSIRADTASNDATSGDVRSQRERSTRVLGRLAPLLLFLYAVVFSLIAFDLIMSLDPRWYSTLFGAYFFMSNLYLGFAVIAITTIVVRKLLRLEEAVTREQLSDLGKLIFAFCLLTGYLLWSQYLVIWYGNLPEETGFLILRTKTVQWLPAAWGVLFLVFVFPFLALLTRRVKRSPTLLLLIASMIAVGMWLERYLLVAPSLDPAQGVVLGWMDLMITGGFFALVVLTYTAFLHFLPGVTRLGARA